MGGGKRALALVSQANSEIKIADHLLSVMHEMTKDPKILLGVANHAKLALAYASQAVLSQDDQHSVPFSDDASLLASGIPESVIVEAKETFLFLSDILESHASSPTAFPRKERYIIAGDGFDSIKEVTFHDVSLSMRHVKNFVHEVNKKIIFGGGEEWKS